MIRRFEYINTINNIVLRDFTTRRWNSVIISFKKVARLNRYEHLSFRFITKHEMRRAWKKRKHSFEYVLYLNVLSLWSTEYVFFRKLIKFNYNYCIAKSTLFVHNYALLRCEIPATTVNSENTYLARLPRVALSYFLKINIRRYKFWLQNLDTTLTVGSYSSNNEIDSKEVAKSCFMNPAYTYSSSVMYSHNTSVEESVTGDELNTFIATSEERYIVQTYELYKLHVLLNLIKINKQPQL